VTEVGRFNTELLLFQEAPKKLSQEKLRFFRWLIVRGWEHPPAGPPAGEVATAIVAISGMPIDEVMHPKSLREHMQANGDY
jgi:hypothetical protein